MSLKENEKYDEALAVRCSSTVWSVDWLVKFVFIEFVIKKSGTIMKWRACVYLQHRHQILQHRESVDELNARC